MSSDESGVSRDFKADIIGVPGDFLVIRSGRQCWDGKRWVDGWRGARRFAPGSGYRECAAEAARLESETGRSCWPHYIPLPSRITSGRGNASASRRS